MSISLWAVISCKTHAVHPVKGRKAMVCHKCSKCVFTIITIMSGLSISMAQLQQEPLNLVCHLYKSKSFPRRPEVTLSALFIVTRGLPS